MADPVPAGAMLDRLETAATGLCAVADMLGGLTTLANIPPQRLAMLLSLLAEPLLEDLRALSDRAARPA